MSTRSRIGIINSNKTITSIYCHFDGYPSAVGNTLFHHYTNTKKIRQLIALGDLSSLGTELGEKHNFDTHNSYSWQTNGNEGPSPSERGWCCAYGRDRKRDDETTKSVLSGNREEFFRLARDSWADYAYLWDVKHSKWLVRFMNADEGEWVELTEKIINEEEN
jgi:hypothetical protein